MKAYSHDLRERVAAACAEPGAKIYQVAARFSVSLSFTDKLLRRQRTSGSVAELPRHPGPARPGAWMRQATNSCWPAWPRNRMRRWPKSAGSGGGRRPVVAAHGRVAGGGTPRLGTQKKHPRHRARHRTRDRIASLVYGSRSGRRCYSFRIRRRDEHQPDLLPPLRECPGRHRAAVTHIVRHQKPHLLAHQQ